MERSTTNLSDEQLHRKRAFDRVNQRISRARKKSRIQELEEEVAGLKQGLARSEMLVQQLQNNESRLRDIIKAACASLQSVDHHNGSSILLPEQPQPDVHRPGPRTSETGHITEEAQPADDAQPSPQPDLDTTRATLPQEETLSIQNTGDPIEPADGVTLRDANTGLSLDLQLTAESHMLDFWGDISAPDLNEFNTFTLDLLGAGMATSPSLSGESFPDRWTSVPSIHIPHHEETYMLPRWTRLPRHVEATGQLDKVLLDLITSSRQHLQSSGEQLEASFPSIKSLLNPAIRDSQYPISNALGQHGKVTMAVSGSPERIACLYNMALLLRWLISPTQSNFEAMPGFLKPVEAQLTTPHPIWIDTIVWPKAREQILQHMDWSEFDDLRQIIGRTVSVHWPYDIASLLTVVSQNELQLSPLFESHVRRLENWTVGPDLMEKFPFLSCVPTSISSLEMVG
ncbi:hypothetical protein DE146DRAFT_789583 [Phaeosphaeria sp. MPI-PUGE-AT-0046c]|nr:hypothetical protein DE146DRAFT_789583 [Phaeosphaeria sp. MPI-PUGE-AT-0046c]